MMTDKTSVTLNSFRRRANTIATKSMAFRRSVTSEFGLCDLRNEAVELEVKSRLMLRHIDNIIIGSGNP